MTTTPNTHTPAPPNIHEVLEQLPGLNGEHAPLQVLGTLQYGSSIDGFIDYWSRFKSTSVLSALEQEMIILRMAYLIQAPYVWAHHIEPLRLAGAEPWHRERVTSLTHQPLETRLDALLQLVDDVVANAQISKKIMDTPLLEPPDLIDALQLISQYYLFSLTTKSFELEVEFEEHADDRLPPLTSTTPN